MKEQLRKQLKAKRRSLSVAEIADKSAVINKKLSDLLNDKKCVMVYLSAFKEVCLDELICKLIRNKKTVSAPITNEEQNLITPYEIKDLENIKHGAYGIREPLPNNKIDINKIDAVLVPGIGFDKRGGRLGFGKGYYDRFLKEYTGLKIGICYDFQLVERIETDKNDIPVDIIVTEKDCYVI